MKFSPISHLALAGAFVGSVANAQQNCQNIDGNYYCNSVQQVVYQNVGFSGSYNQVTSFNSDGTCSSTPFGFSGSLAPLNEEVTVHFRGPINLKQFAVYSLGGSGASQKREIIEDEIQKRHVHHMHKREPALVTEFVHVTKTVIAGENNLLAVPSSSEAAAPAPVAVSSSDAAPPAPAAPSSSSSPAPAPVLPSSSSVAVAAPPPSPSSSSTSTTSTTSVAAPPPPTTSTTSTSSIAVPTSFSTAVPSSSASSSSSSNNGNGWSQIGFYDSSSGSSNGLTFMNNLGGGSCAGVWDSQFGNSVTYAGTDGVSCAASPQVLGDVTVPSNKEFIIFSDSQCNGNDCGYYRPGIPAYHGFGGDSKMFLFEFSMPSAGSGSGFNFDMPAIWLLNAQIPRTLQYGAESCSCWSSGCGEFDIFEVLNSGNNMLTNHLHSGQGSSGSSAYGGGGTADYFTRPTSGTMKAACIFDAGSQTITITALDDSVDFSSGIDTNTVQGWLSGTSNANTFVAIA